MKTARHARYAHHARPRGFALITALLLVIVCAGLAISMYRGFGLQEKIAGNTLDKQRSQQAAQSALQYGEWWIASGGGASATGIACSGVVVVSSLSDMRICDTPLSPADTVALPWPARSEYTPPRMSVQAGGGLNTNAAGIVGDVNYAAVTHLYIAYLGLGPDGKTQLYQVTGAGSGGDGATASVVQSVYAMTFPTTSLTGP